MNTDTQDQNYLKNLKILYVEDEENTREQFSAFLGHCSGVLVTTANGAEGFEAYLLHKPDIIVTDIRMPVMDGLTMVSKIRELDKSVQIIVLTAYDQSDYLMKAINIDIDRYVTKPVDINKFQEALLVCTNRLLMKKQLEQSRKEIVSANNILNSIIENMTDWVWEIDAERRYSYCSPQVERFLGYSSAEIIGKTPFDLMSPEETERVGTLFGEIMHNKAPIKDLENWNIHKDGHEVLLVTSGVPILDASGNLLGYRGFDRDISAQRNAEEALKVKEKFYHSTINGLSAHICVINDQGEIIATNKAWNDFAVANGMAEGTFGVGVKYLQQFGEIVADIEDFQNGFRAVIDGTLPQFTYEYSYHRPDEERWFSFVVSSFYIDEKRYSVISHTKITERKLAELALRGSEERYSALFNDARDALITFSMQTLNFKNVNNSAIEMFGAVNGDELLATTPWAFSPKFQPCGLPSDIKAEEMISIALRNGYHIFEWQHERANGEIFPTEVLLSSMQIKDETLLMATIRDNTEIIAAKEAKDILEQQLQQAQKMEAIGNLAGGVAHDFNNKLMVIMGYVTLAQMNIDDSASVLKYLEQINLAAEHSRDITVRLLTFSRRQVSSPQILNPNHVIAEALKSLSRLIGEHIAITYVPDDNLWNVQIDPVQLDQIVMNLAVNARDAMPEGGTFTIESINVTMDLISCSSNIECVPGDYVRITFSDSGCGIKQDTLLHIFEPFFTTKEVGKGTGLGLATIYGIIGQNDGFIDVDSTPGSGTSFKVYLPRHEAPAAEIIKSDNVICTGSGSILLVEDDEEVRLVAARFLKKIGYSVYDTESPHKALELASDLSIQIDLIITDVVMPEMNGIVMMEQIQKIRPGIGCIYASGYSSDHSYLSEASKAGINFMQKPYDLIKLSKYLNRAIKNNQEE